MDRKIIAIEGLDGSGKGTQYKLLRDYMEKRYGKERVEGYTFPDYEGKYGSIVGEILSGKYGDLALELPAKVLSTMYALDRRKTVPREFREEVEYVLFDRYVLSNLVYQGMKEEDKAGFYEWLMELEHDELGLPEPDVYIVLDVGTVERAQENIGKKGTRGYVGDKADEYESSKEVLGGARELYNRYASKLENVVKVNSVDEEGEMLGVEDIHKKIVGVLESRGLLS